MKKLLLLGSLLLVSGCRYTPPQAAVYGHSGTAFTAPNLCAALVACLNSREASCFYDRQLMTTASGTQAWEECKEVKK